MEDPDSKMEEIYALPPKLKYNESWLELKEKKGFTDYWVVLKGTYIFFFKDQNTHAKEQYVGYIAIEVQQTKCTAKKGSNKEFKLEIGKKKNQLRANDDILRRRWMHAIDLVNRADPPGPLPGDLDFKEVHDPTPSPNKMKQRANTIAAIPSNFLPQSTLTCNDDLATRRSDRRGLSLNLPNQIPEMKSENENEISTSYDSVFVPPSWYYSSMSRQEAEQILSDQPIGSYLLRDTDRNNSLDHYALSIKDNMKTRHHKIVPRSDGKCYFDSSPDAPFPSPIQAVEYLMRKTYPHLNSQPVCGTDRRAGDGQEEIKQIESPREGGGRKLSENPYLTNLTSPFREGNQFARNSATSSLVSPTTQSKDISPPPFQSVKSRKTNSLPGEFSMAGRPLPDLPSYANAASIRRHCRSYAGESYIDMQPKWTENEGDDDNDDDVLIDAHEADIPPPLPRKKHSLPAKCYDDHTYVNLSFHLNRANFSYPQTFPDTNDQEFAPN